MQTPETHVSPASHGMPHSPQCALLVCRSTSQPSNGLPLQSAVLGAVHEAIAQVPVAQVVVAPVAMHVTPQPPQLVSVFSCVSHSGLEVSQLP